MLKKRRLVILSLIGSICLVYIFFTSSSHSDEDSEAHAVMVKRAKYLQIRLEKSNKAIADIEHQINLLERGLPLPQDLNNAEVVKVKKEPIVISNRGDSSQLSYSLASLSPSKLVCDLAETPPSNPDIQMYDVLDSISFDDVDGGVWKQGFPISYEASKWTTEKPLKVFVIPHSHDDPGWIKTYDSYYNSQVKHILDNMVIKLGEHEKMKFIYAEISFFSTWWGEATSAQKAAVKRFIEEGRLELVTGGWVMPDEAASHYWAIIDQLIEGHAWIKENVGIDVVPQSGWSIDPFGHTSTMAYILQQSGLKNMLIQRVHYSVKKHFAQNHYLEFNWRQMWDKQGSTDILCHMMPFYSYDVPHTCGPDPKICCQFDFQRLPGGKLHCPWRKEPQPITSSNVQDKALTLLDQYRKKSTLYKSNVVLIPLGDDFRYTSGQEWDKQYTNYQMLFDYMNQQADWHVQAQFGTLSDYFNELRKAMGQPDPDKSSLANFPSLSGDFYTYADRADHYWSGYFTSRPFYKHWDRHLEATLRSAEIIFTQAQAKAHAESISSFQTSELYEKLTYARRSLGLFQHHDGITGTAKASVVIDYGKRMLKGWKSAQEVIRVSAQLLVSERRDGVEMFDVEWIKDAQDALEVKKVHEILKGSAKKFVIYNSSPHERVEMVRLWISSLPVAVYDSKSAPIICQVSPYFTSSTGISHDIFKLSFLVRIPALGMATYEVEGAERHPCAISAVSFYNAGSKLALDTIFNPVAKEGDQFTIHNHQLEVTLSSNTGMVQAVSKKGGKSHNLAMKFVRYRSATGSDHASGAYLFIPNGGSQVEVDANPLIVVVEGNLFHEVITHTKLVEHHVRLVNTPGAESLGVELTNIDEINSEDNTELAMQFTSDVKNEDRTFYSDMNGFTMHKRKYQEKLHIQGNVYPMTSMAYLEDEQMRVSILATQSAGVISSTTGSMQVILDRRLNQDDNRGVGEAIKDNKRTESKFFLLIEERTTPPKQKSKPIGYPSMMANIVYHHLASPLITLPVSSGIVSRAMYQPLTKSWPCELNLVNLRSTRGAADGQVTSDSLLLVHHHASDCGFPTNGLTCTSDDGKLDLKTMFRNHAIKTCERRTLTDLSSRTDHSPVRIVQVEPMNVVTFRLTLQ